MDPLKALEAKKAQILADANRAAAEIERDMAAIENMKQIADKYGFDFVCKGDDTDSRGGMAGAGKAKTRRNPNSVSQIAQRASEQMIRLIDEPIEINDLLEWLQTKGVNVQGKRPIGTLSAYLSANDKLASMRKGWWGLKDWSGTEKSSQGKRLHRDEMVAVDYLFAEKYKDPDGNRGPMEESGVV